MPMIYTWSDTLKILLLALIYHIAIRLVIGYLTADGFISIIWIPSGIGFATLLLKGKKFWLGIFLGAVSAYLSFDRPLPLAALVALSNCAESLVGSWLLLKNPRFDRHLHHIYDFNRLMLVGSVSAALAAFIGVLSLKLSATPPDNFFLAFRLWWMGNFLGIVVITPIILIWRKIPRDWLSAKHLPEALLFICLAFLCGQLVFYNWFSASLGFIARDYWAFMFAIWGASRFGRHGALFIVGLFALQGLLGALSGQGIFSTDIESTRLSNYWFFIIILAIVSLSLSLVLEGWRHALLVARNAEREAIHQMQSAENARQELWHAFKKQQETENFLKHERDLNKLYLNTVAAIVVVLDIQGTIRMINRKGCEILGHTETELLGKNWFSYCLPQPKGLSQQLPLFQQLIQNPYTDNAYLENEIITRQGQTRLVAWHHHPLNDPQGNITGILSSGEDITERKYAETQLTMQMAELQRWHNVTLNREARIIELKQEINYLLSQLQQAPRFTSLLEADQQLGDKGNS